MELSHQLTEEVDLIYQGHDKRYRYPGQNTSKGEK